MREAPEYTQRAVGFGRMYFVALGAVLLTIGALGGMFWEAPMGWFGGTLAVAGIVVLLYSASKPGKNVAHSARKMLEDFDE